MVAMSARIVIAKVTTGDSIGLLHCHGVQAGDVIMQALAWSNGDDVCGVFAPIVPAVETLAQVKPVAGIECLLLLHRMVPDGQ
jgi:hypothetical protein